MKKFYVLIAMCLIASMTFAQTFHVGSSKSRKFIHEIGTSKVATDTAGLSGNFLPVFAVGLQVVTYTDLSGGYVYGVNGNAFPAVAQGYTYVPLSGSYPIGIEGVAAFFCGKKSVSGSPTSKISFSVYNKPDSVPTTMIGTTTADITFDNADTNFLAFNTASFPSTILVNADFSIVCSFANIMTDTIGFFSDQDGEGIGYTALKYGSTWYTYYSSYGGLNTNISIFAIVDADYVSVNDVNFFQGSQMTIKQNPTFNTLALDYAVQNDSKVIFELIDLKGQVVLKLDEGNKTSGTVNSIYADISNLAAGTYLCSLNCNGQRLIKKLVIQ